MLLDLCCQSCFHLQLLGRWQRETCVTAWGRADGQVGRWVLYLSGVKLWSDSLKSLQKTCIPLCSLFSLNLS